MGTLIVSKKFVNTFETMNRKRNKGKGNNNGKKSKNRGYGLPNNGYTGLNRPRFSFLDPHMYVTLKYSQNITLTNLTTVASNQVFRLNSIFDPDFTGGGHQPYGFDQLAALYNRYRVLKTHWKVQWGGANNTIPVLVTPTNGALPVAITTGATFEAASEVPFASVRMLSSGGPTIICSGTMPLNVLGGVSVREFVADDRFEATTSANPAEVVLLNVASFNPNAVTSVVYFVITLEYYVDLHDPILVAQS